MTDDDSSGWRIEPGSRPLSVLVRSMSKRYGGSAAERSRLLGWLERTAARGGEHDGDDDEDEILDGGDDAIAPVSNAPIWALRDIDLEIPAGSSLAILGPNGSGKSTLIRVLARITPPTTGRIRMRGRVAPLLELASAFMQAHATCRRNIVLLARLFGVPDEVALRHVDEIAAFAGVERLLDRPVRQLSSGLQRRLAFAIVLHLEADILLADEILAVGDSAFREQCLARVEAERRRGLTVLFATHNLDHAERICSQAIRLEQGRIVSAGTTADVISTLGEGAKRKRPRPKPVLDEVTAAALPGAPGAAPEPAPAERVRAEVQPLPAGGAEAPAPGKRSFSADAAIVAGSATSLLGDPVATVAGDEAVRLSMSVDVATPGVLVRCVFVLYDSRQPRYRIEQPEPFPVAEAGMVRARVLVPGGLLHDGRYQGRLGAWVTRDGATVPLVRGNAFALEVIDLSELEDDTEPNALPGGGKSWGSVVELGMLDWSVQHPRRKAS